MLRHPHPICAEVYIIAAGTRTGQGSLQTARELAATVPLLPGGGRCGSGEKTPDTTRVMSRIIRVGVMDNRYEDQLTEFARVIHGEIENPYPYEHELLVHETILAASGYTRWEGGQPTG